MKIVLWKRLSYALAAVALMAIAIAAKDIRTISMRDDCDQATFDAAVGPGTCVGDGDTLFADFLDEVLATGSHPKWRFNNSVTDADVAAKARNEGGETHSFTPVKQFGGGFIEVLNLGADPAKECALRDAAGNLVRDDAGNLIPATAALNTLIPAGATGRDEQLGPGKNLFQCCIHPWMRSTVTRR